jgi:hypothetical protein
MLSGKLSSDAEVADFFPCVHKLKTWDTISLRETTYRGWNSWMQINRKPMLTRNCSIKSTCLGRDMFRGSESVQFGLKSLGLLVDMLDMLPPTIFCTRIVLSAHQNCLYLSVECLTTNSAATLYIASRFSVSDKTHM